MEKGNDKSDFDKEIAMLEWKLEFARQALQSAKMDMPEGLCYARLAANKLSKNLEIHEYKWNIVMRPYVETENPKTIMPYLYPLKNYMPTKNYLHYMWLGNYGIKRVELLIYMCDNLKLEDFVWKI